VIDPATDTGRALIDNLLTQQATIIGFSNSFNLLMILSLISLPFLLIIGSSKVKTAAVEPPGEAVHAMD
jgi:DHA2 family multidrug resistance protein